MTANFENVGFGKNCIKWLIAIISSELDVAAGVCDSWSGCVASQDDEFRQMEDLGYVHGARRLGARPTAV